MVGIPGAEEDCGDEEGEVTARTDFSPSHHSPNLIHCARSGCQALTRTGICANCAMEGVRIIPWNGQESPKDGAREIVLKAPERVVELGHFVVAVSRKHAANIIGCLAKQLVDEGGSGVTDCIISRVENGVSVKYRFSLMIDDKLK